MIQNGRAYIPATVLFLLCGCGDDAVEGRVGPPAAPASVQVDTAPPAPPPSQPSPEPAAAAPDQIRGLYLNADAVGSAKRLAGLLALADSTEINAFVIDVKDERGTHYTTGIGLARDLARDEPAVTDLPALLDTLHARGIYAIARLVVFNDPVLAAARPEWSIRKENGEIWLDRAGNSWVSPWDRRVWEHNLAIAVEVARAGFDEVQFDYVRFPEQFTSLPAQVHPRADGDRTDAIAAFLREARGRLHPLGVAVAADVFGLSPNTYEDVGIGQQWERLSVIVDHILPMMYPSHYFPTHLPDVARPHEMPYETIYKSAGMARLRNGRMADAGLDPARTIVWLQAFQATWLRDGVEYGPQEVELQKQAVYDVGLEDWILWHPGSRYERFVPALERRTESRATQNYTPPEDVLRIVDRFEELGVERIRTELVDQGAAPTEDRGPS
ncbi:MAG: putative glycoside hydrolase [Gemmatimonadota bacterium]